MGSEHRPVDVWGWVRLSIACFVGAIVLTLGVFFWAGYGLASPDARFGAALIRAVVLTILVGLVLAGLLTALLAIRTAVGVGTVQPPNLDGILAAGKLPTRGRVAIAAIFSVANFAVLGVGAAHILVWNPLARVPGLPLDEIYAQMRAVGEGTGAGGFVAAWAAFWALLTVAYLLATSLPGSAPVLTGRRLVVVGLALIGATCAFHWFAGFNMGMSLADAFATGGGDAAWSGPLVAVVGQLALIAALFVGLAPRRATAAPAPTAAPA